MSKPETKTEIPNARTDAPRTEIPRTEIPRPEMPRFDFPGFEPWVQAATANVERLQSTLTAYWNELSSYENVAYERARTASNDLAKLATESMTYANQLATEWRKLGLEATRKFTEQFAKS